MPDWNNAAPSPDLVLIKQAKQVQILALPRVCGGGLAKKDRVLAHPNREREHRVSKYKVLGGSR